MIMKQVSTHKAFNLITQLRSGPSFVISKKAGLHKERSLPLIMAQLPTRVQFLDELFVVEIRESDLPNNLEAVFKEEQCPQCYGFYFVVDPHKGLRVCFDCKHVMDSNYDTKASYSDSHGPAVNVSSHQNQVLPRPHQQSSTKRMTHFRNWLNRLQAKEDKPGIPYDLIKAECLKYNLVNPGYDNMRFILKKLKLQRYYNNVFLVIFNVTGTRLVTLTRDQEKILIRMFALIQPYYTRVCAKRVNFISYAFVIRKICDSLGWHDLAMSMPRIKSDEINYQIMKVWHSIIGSLDESDSGNHIHDSIGRTKA
jgi:hypothetical protein